MKQSFISSPSSLASSCGRSSDANSSKVVQTQKALENPPVLLHIYVVFRKGLLGAVLVGTWRSSQRSNTLNLNKQKLQLAGLQWMQFNRI